MRKKPVYGLEPWWERLKGADKKAAAGGYGIVWEELASAGFVGLLEALGRFDPTRGAFSTCADDNIRKAIREEIAFLYQPVKMAGWSTSLTIVPNEFDEEPERDDRDAVFYDGSSNETDHEDRSDPEEALLKLALDHLLEACTTLTRQERQVIDDRFDSDPLTLRELAVELGVCHQRVHRVENTAITKIAAAQISLAALPRFYLCPPNARTMDTWLDVIGQLFPPTSESDRKVAHRIAACWKDTAAFPLFEVPPPKQERFRESDKLLTRCFIVSETGEVQHNRWLAPAHHAELPKEKKELWRKQSRNPLWRPKTYPGRQLPKERIAVITPSPKRTPFWAHSTFHWWAPDLNHPAAWHEQWIAPSTVLAICARKAESVKLAA